MHRAQGSHALKGIAGEIGDIAQLVAALTRAGHIGAHRDDLRIAGVGKHAHVISAQGPRVALGSEVVVKVGKRAT